MSVPVITVDGPGGAGKGTLCFSLARYLGWRLLDSGALYRVVAHAAARSCWPGVKVLPSRAFLRPSRHGMRAIETARRLR